MAARDGSDFTGVLVAHDGGAQFLIQLHQLKDTEAPAVAGVEAASAARAAVDRDGLALGRHRRAGRGFAILADQAHQALGQHRDQ